MKSSSEYFPFHIGDKVWVIGFWCTMKECTLENVLEDCGTKCLVRPDHARDLGVAEVPMEWVLSKEEAVALRLMDKE
jgi:hypothetical protein